MSEEQIEVNDFDKGKTIKLTKMPYGNVFEDDNRIYISFDGANDVPEIFTKEQADYLNALVGYILLRNLKGDILDIVESCGLPEKQEAAVKRQITNVLYDLHYKFNKDIELVLKKSLKITGTTINEIIVDSNGIRVCDSANVAQINMGIKE